MLSLSSVCRIIQEGGPPPHWTSEQIVFCQLCNKLVFVYTHSPHLWPHSTPSVYAVYVLTERLVGDALMLTGFLSYAGPFNQEFRSRILGNWKKELSDRKVPYSAELHVTGALVDQATISEWNLQGQSMISFPTINTVLPLLSLIQVNAAIRCPHFSSGIVGGGAMGV